MLNSKYGFSLPAFAMASAYSSIAALISFNNRTNCSPCPSFCGYSQSISMPSNPRSRMRSTQDLANCLLPSGDPAKPVDPPAPGEVRTSGETAWTLTTNQGPVTITMDRSRTPCTVHSFESLARQKYFDNTQCHRLVDSGIFVLQCGDPTGTGRGGPGYRFADEVSGSEKYPAGTVAMANAGKDTNGSQFFITCDATT